MEHSADLGKTDVREAEPSGDSAGGLLPDPGVKRFTGEEKIGSGLHDTPGSWHLPLTNQPGGEAPSEVSEAFFCIAHLIRFQHLLKCMDYSLCPFSYDWSLILQPLFRFPHQVTCAIGSRAPP